MAVKPSFEDVKRASMLRALNLTGDEMSNIDIEKKYWESEGYRSLSKVLAGSNGFQRVVGTPPTVTLSAANAATTIAGSVTVPAGSDDASLILSPYIGTPLRYEGNRWARAGASFPQDSCVRPAANVGQFIDGGVGSVRYLYDGTQFEIVHRGSGKNVFILIDGVPASRSTYSLGVADGSTYRLLVNMGSAALREITLIGNFDLFNITIEPTAGIYEPPESPFVVACTGDSFTEPGGLSWLRVASQILGWKNVWNMAQGATGWFLTSGDGTVSTNGRGNFLQRVSHMIESNAMVYIWPGGINDYGHVNASLIASQFHATLDQVDAAKPSAIHFVIGPFWRNGVSTVPDALWTFRDNLKAAALQRERCVWIDPLEEPLLGPSIPGLITSNTSAGITSFNSSTRYRAGSTVKIGTKRYVVASVSGGGPFNHVLSALGGSTTLVAAVAINDPIVNVGNCIWTGSGKVTALAGVGNSDIYVQNDGTHPTQPEGQEWLGVVLANRIATEIRRLAA